MDRKEAKLILSALRPDAAEANEPIFAESLAMVESDPELRAWWQAQQEFDRKIAAKLEGVPVPADLRDRILAAPKITAFPPQWRHRSLLAAAALVALLCVATTFWNVGGNGSIAMNRADFTDQAIAELGTNGPQLARLSTDHEQLKAWLRQQDAPIGKIPPTIAPMPSIGCQKYVVAGHVVSLICFSLANGHQAHLFMVNKGALSNPPGSSGPQYGNKNGWNMATWSDSNMSYVLATDASMDDLKQLFSSG
jgi:anti-sigma factor RsiW